MSSADPTHVTPAPAPGPASPVTDPGVLREPANLVSPRAVAFWRVSALVGALLVAVPLVVAYVWFVPEHPWWGTLLLALVLAGLAFRVVVMPPVRYRIHRWEVTPTAVFTRSGWLQREERIAPLSRVQTVDSHQGAVMRLFGLASITVTTASAAGPLRIDCLDADVARRTVAELTEITAASEGDAT
ncbi:MAG: PH domain-containing protein [Nocardioidaceae bacterium]